MKKEEFTQTLKTVLEKSPKRKFKQTVDLIINLKDINLKKPEDKVDTFITLPKPIGKNIKICALIGSELKEQASKFCDKFILDSDFSKFEGKKKDIKKLAQEFDFFIAQAPLMGRIAKIFGRFFGPRRKMPNPKSGCVVPPNANLEPLIKKLKQTIRVQVRNAPLLQIMIGKEDASQEDLLNNINTIYSHLVHVLPKEEHNINNILLKLTMGPSVEVGKPWKEKKVEKKESKEKLKKEKSKVKEKSKEEKSAE